MVGVSQIAPPRDRSIASLTREIKYVLPAAAASPLADWLGAVCRPERARPPAWVVSVYFDTPGLSFLDEKVNSDYYKTKVRVRWYRAAGHPGPLGAEDEAFVELKQRIGSRRDKRRVRLGLSGDAIARWSLDDPRWSDLLAPLGALAPLPARLMPVLRIEYLRSRFVDAASSARLAVDRRIAVTAAAHRLRARPLPVPLADAVFEWKGPSADLPARLAPVTRFGARRGSFSKYLACVHAACPQLA